MTGGVWQSSDMTTAPLDPCSGVAAISQDCRPWLVATRSLKQTGCGNPVV